MTPEQHHALTWTMLVTGEKRWRFRAEFAGVILTCKDRDGDALKTLRRHTSCWQSDGWRPACFLFRTPPEAVTVAVQFAIVSSEALPGWFEIRGVRLQDLEAPPRLPDDAGLLTFTIRDPSGDATPARIYLRDEKEKSYVPDFAFTYELGGTCFHLQDPRLGRMALPPGRYELAAMKGFDYEPVSAQFSVAARAKVNIDLEFARHRDRAFRDWKSGDHHTHLFRHGGSVYPMMDLEDVFTVAQGEGLDYLPFMGEDRIPEGLTLSDAGPFLASVTEELTRDLWGHICPVGVSSWPVFEEYDNAWPMNFEWIQAANQRRGGIAYAHPYGPLRDKRELEILADTESGLIAREYPIDLALGLPCTLDILAKEDAQGDFAIKLRDYMRLLNLGFRSGVSGSTDFHLDQGRQPIGGIRTYCHVRELTWPEIGRAYREGRTFATNGPLLRFEVQDCLPGESLRLHQPGKVTCHVFARSLWGMDKVQLWMNGRLVSEVPATEGAVRQRLDVDVERSGWVLAIATGPAAGPVMSKPEGKPMVDGQYAITSPVYIEVAHQPLPPDPEAAAYFVAWTDAVKAAFDSECAQMTANGSAPPDKVRAVVEARLAQARTVFEAKASGR
ncbi:MAG: CehA/McbA family metallohydrolase [Candidatus Hydrogenedentes bacterium]|nr:CehA/McbA family metallohydrolase [Candidatus Hydrogenedentota bacterium]